MDIQTVHRGSHLKSQHSGGVKAQELVQGQPRLYSIFQASLVYRRQNRTNNKTMTKQEKKESTFGSVTRKPFKSFY